MLPHLRSVRSRGVRLYMDGMEATPETIAEHCVRQEGLYMPDYVIDEDGKLTEIRYDRVSGSS